VIARSLGQGGGMIEGRRGQQGAGATPFGKSAYPPDFHFAGLATMVAARRAISARRVAANEQRRASTWRNSCCRRALDSG